MADNSIFLCLNIYSYQVLSWAWLFKTGLELARPGFDFYSIDIFEK